MAPYGISTILASQAAPVPAETQYLVHTTVQNASIGIGSQALTAHSHLAIIASPLFRVIFLARLYVRAL